MKKHAGDIMCLYLCPDYISPVIFKTISSKLKKKKITLSDKLIIYYFY